MVTAQPLLLTLLGAALAAALAWVLALVWLRRVGGAHGNGQAELETGSPVVSPLLVLVVIMLGGAALMAASERSLPRWMNGGVATQARYAATPTGDRQAPRRHLAEVQLFWGALFLVLHAVLLLSGPRERRRWHWLAVHVTATAALVGFGWGRAASAWWPAGLFACSLGMHAGALLVAARLTLGLPPQHALPASDGAQQLARDLHDGVAGRLVTLLMRLDPAIPAQQPLRLEVEDCLLELQMVVDRLHHPQLTTVADGLADLRYRVQPALDRQGMALRWEVDTQATGLPTAHVAHLGRIAQEALSNVLRHSGAKQVLVQWQIDGEAGGGNATWELRIEDDGRGLPPERGRTSAGRGLDNMRVRANAMGALLSLEPMEPRGARVCVRSSNGAQTGPERGRIRK